MFRISLLIGVLSAILLGGCGTMNAARPLQAGEHRVGFNFGGPFTTSLGPPIPIPNLVVEARSGLKPLGSVPIDLNYGLNMTTFAFGVTGFHTGASLHLLEQNGGWPALSVTERVHVYNNVLGTSKPKAARTWWGLNEFDITASWLAGRHVLYTGMSDALDLGDPEWLISPFFGAELRGKGERFAWQLESRWLGANFSPDVYDVSWLNTGDPGHGLFAFTIGASWRLGAGGPS
jgi:hypothetical protein